MRHADGNADDSSSQTKPLNEYHDPYSNVQKLAGLEEAAQGAQARFLALIGTSPGPRVRDAVVPSERSERGIFLQALPWGHPDGGIPDLPRNDDHQDLGESRCQDAGASMPRPLAGPFPARAVPHLKRSRPPSIAACTAAIGGLARYVNSAKGLEDYRTSPALTFALENPARSFTVLTS